MSRDSSVLPFRQPDAIDDPRSELAREGARRMLAQVLIAEADSFVAMWKALKLPDGRDRIVRHGHGPHRAIQTGVGPVEVRRAKVRDRGDVVAEEKIRFSLGVSCISLRVRRAVSLGRSFVSQTSKRKRRSRTVPVLSAAGLSLSLASGAAIATPTPSLDTITRKARESHENILREEEICDVSLVTFCVFDKEGAGAFRAGERLIRVGGCCLFACLAGQSSTEFEGASAPGNNAYSLSAPRPIRPTRKHVRKKR
jgi:hypothetical protein